MLKEQYPVMNLNEKKDCITACAGTKVHDCLLLEVGKALAKLVQFESCFNGKKNFKKIRTCQIFGGGRLNVIVGIFL